MILLIAQILLKALKGHNILAQGLSPAKKIK